MRIAIILSLFLAAVNAHAWNDNTHIAISRAAGYDRWYNSATADAAKLKAGKIEELNHYCNIPLDVKIIRDTVLKQVPYYNSSDDENGHLYGAVLGALNTFINNSEINKYSEYSLAYMAHYVGDLSQPLHNMEYNQFNKEMHLLCDGVVDAEVLENLSEIQKNMYTVTINKATFQYDIADAICRIAIESRVLAKRIEIEKRPISKVEAYRQLGHSASLLKGILKFLETTGHR